MNINDRPQNKKGADDFNAAAKSTLNDLLTQITDKRMVKGYEIELLIAKELVLIDGDEYQANANADAMTSEQFPNV